MVARQAGQRGEAFHHRRVLTRSPVGAQVIVIPKGL
jgi:hypothetical protein